MNKEPNITIIGQKQKNIALNESNIKSYFCKLIELQKKNELFPVDLDLVWPIAYTRVDHCVAELRNSFIEGIDYQQLPIKRERSDKFRQKDEYRLSISCMEYLIVRKVRPIFEVYRQMFTLSVGQLGLSTKDNQSAIKEHSTDKPVPLNRKSPLQEVKDYINHIRTLSENGDIFPVDVDDVWALAYSAKRRITDRLLGINQYIAHYIDGEHYRFEDRGTVNAISGRPQGKYYLSLDLFETLVINTATNLRSIYKEVFGLTTIALGTKDEVITSALKDINEESIIRKKSTVADAFQQLITVQLRLESIKDRDALQRVMLVLSDYNMLLNRIHPDNE